MVMVKKLKGESEDKLIARFRKKVLNSGVIWNTKTANALRKNLREEKSKSTGSVTK